MHARAFGLVAIISVLPHVALAVPFAGLVANGSSTSLVGFNSATPGTITATLPVTGLLPGDGLVAIDTRPATGQLYAFGNSNLYTINALTGAATYVATTSTPVPFGFDMAFDPVSGALRIVANRTQNVSVNPITGATTVNGTLAYAPGDVHAGSVPYIGAIAYTNQDVPNPTSTQLYGIDLALGALVQIDPDGGTLRTVGAAGVPFASFGGFDITGVGNVGYVTSAMNPGIVNFDSIDLATGAARVIGPTQGGSLAVLDIAEAQVGSPAAVVPEPFSLQLLAFALISLIAARQYRNVR